MLGPHLRRSNVARYNRNIAVCRTLAEVLAACERQQSAAAVAAAASARQRPAVVVIKEEFSSAGLGVRLVTTVPLLSADEATAAAAEAAHATADPSSGAHEPLPALLAKGTATERWVEKCLRRDGVVTVEPWLPIAAEFSAEWLDGRWNGLSQCLVDEHMRYQGQYLGHPLDRLSAALHDFAYVPC